MHDVNAKYAPPLRIGLPAERRSRIDEVLKLKVRARDGALVPLSEVVQAIPVQRDYPIYHKDLLPVVYVFGDMAGKPIRNGGAYFALTSCMEVTS